jgi:hypothetical protein
MRSITFVAMVCSLMALSVAWPSRVTADEISPGSLSVDIQKLRKLRTDDVILDGMMKYLFSQGPWMNYGYAGELQTEINKLLAQSRSPKDILDHVVAIDTQRKKQLESRLASEKRTAVRQVCQLQVTCTKFSQARQQCATAGSYNTCMSIKLEDLREAESSCMPDGALRYYKADDVPSWLECLASRLP